VRPLGRRVKPDDDTLGRGVANPLTIVMPALAAGIRAVGVTAGGEVGGMDRGIKSRDDGLEAYG